MKIKKHFCTHLINQLILFYFLIDKMYNNQLFRKNKTQKTPKGFLLSEMKVISDESYHKGPHQHCVTNHVETKSGTFSFHTNRKTKEGARQFCRARGEILAPITNWDDFWQIKNFTDGCTNFGGGRIYSTGLDFVDAKNRYLTR